MDSIELIIIYAVNGCHQRMLVVAPCKADTNVEINQICDIFKRWSQIKVAVILIIFLLEYISLTDKQINK